MRRRESRCPPVTADVTEANAQLLWECLEDHLLHRHHNLHITPAKSTADNRLHMFAYNDDSIAKQTLQWTPHGHRDGQGKRKTKEHLEKIFFYFHIWVEDGDHCQQNTELVGEKWSVAYVRLGATRHKSQSFFVTKEKKTDNKSRITPSSYTLRAAQKTCITCHI